jgi:hypothetical protein
MKQPSLMLRTGAPRQFQRPPLEVGPIGRAIGQIRHILDAGGPCEMTHVGETQVSPRRTEPVYRLSTGETVVVTKRPNIDLPDDVDGVLRELENGSFKWSSHRRVKAFEELVTKDGWSTVAKKNSANWSGEFSFRSEQSGAGQGDPEGLRPPQLGALHSIGAH